MLKQFIASVCFLLALSHSNAMASEKPLVIIGEKISVDSFDYMAATGKLSLDAAFRAKYRVISVVEGSFFHDSIEFEAFDHYGRPKFENYRYIMLFLLKDGNRYYLPKHQYFAVFKTISGEWAACGSIYRLKKTQSNAYLMPRPLDFGPDAYFDVSALSPVEIRRMYPRSHFSVKDGKAHCKLGTPASNLLTLWQEHQTANQ